MKKTLITLAALALASVANAADPVAFPNANDYGNYEIASGNTYNAATYSMTNPIKAGGTNEASKVYCWGGDIGLYVADSATIAGLVGNDDKSFRKEGDGVLTLLNDISTNANYGYEYSLNAVVEAGTLKLGNGGAVNNITVNENGTLDLTNVTSVKASSITLNAGSRLVLGEGSLTTTGATLTVQSGAIIDLSSWGIDVNQFDDEQLFSGVSNLVFTDADGNVLTDEKYGYISIDFGDGNLWDNYLYNAGDGKVNAVPEPATATLSLLALAGLAARRRRK